MNPRKKKLLRKRAIQARSTVQEKPIEALVQAPEEPVVLEEEEAPKPKPKRRGRRPRRAIKAEE